MCTNGPCDCLTYAARYAPCHVVPRIKFDFNASHVRRRDAFACRGCCCDTTVFSGDHPFECEFCGSCFRDDGTLRGHKRIHTGEKPYECNGCGKRFSLKHQLETHYRVHTGEKARESTLKHNTQEGRLCRVPGTVVITYRTYFGYCESFIAH